MNKKIALPIDAISERILTAYDSFANIILKASPGSGKTTRVPLYLLEKTSKKIYILEPRRLAAKLAAQHVARELGEAVGKTVGYLFRYEKVMSEQTRILFLTEGTFLKILSQNKKLEDVGIVILDEFHERHLSTDAALSFLYKLQKEARPDLKIMVMSATIETENLQSYLESSGPTTTLELNSQRYPLIVNYLPNTTSIVGAPLHKKIRNAIEDILESDANGDILVFLPGMREIRESQSSLLSLCEHHDIHCLILHGDLDAFEQDEVLKISSNRKIILSTNIAESSVTIPGIRIVVDSGLQRESSYNFYSGLPELKITKISRASATQRAGRANREGAGYCYRLYAELDFEQRPYLQKPEVHKSDLSELYLMSLELFNIPLGELFWFENPPESALKNSNELLFAINAINTKKEITDIGRAILKYPLHPRLGRIMVHSEKFSEKTRNDILNFLAEFLGEKNKERFKKLLGRSAAATSASASLEELILTGFPDRVARARGGNFFDLVTKNGETLKIAKEISHEFDPNHLLWVVLDLNNKGEVSKCIPIMEDWLYDLEPFPFNDEIKYSWDEKKEQVTQYERVLLGKLVLSESRSTPKTFNASIKSILLEKGSEYLDTLKNSVEFERLLTLNRIHKNIEIDFTKLGLLDEFFDDQIHFNQEDKSGLAQFFFNKLKDVVDPEGHYSLETDFPLSIQLSDRRKIPIIYDRAHDPFIESLIQDFYGLSKTPILAKGKISLTLKLLGPHKLAIQVTQDLSSFWTKTYPQMVGALSRDYPRHYWPTDPQNARPILLKRQVPV